MGLWIISTSIFYTIGGLAVMSGIAEKLRSKYPRYVLTCFPKYRLMYKFYSSLVIYNRIKTVTFF